ncbi:MAG: DNA repair protein RecO [Paludibacteraceae bacterium]|nr:DNA repair protein RecO [Paludibacteraceae bacterium]
MRAIVLTSTLYSDNSYMLNLFTDELGYVVVSVKVGKRSKVRLSHIQPLTLLSVELHGRPSQQVMHITECVALAGCEQLMMEPNKVLMAQFLAEFLQHALRSMQRDERLFEFIFNSIRRYNDIERGDANFHLVFLIKLTHFLGFFPNLEGFDSGVCFDLENGCFVRRLPLHNNYLLPNDTMAFVHLLRLDYDTMYLLDANRRQRNDILDHIVKYYKLHMAEFGELRSLDVLREI